MTMQGDEMKALRKAAGLTQGEFADALGMNRVTISSMERGEAPLEKRTRMATHLQARYDRYHERRARALRTIELIDKGWTFHGSDADGNEHDDTAEWRADRVEVVRLMDELIAACERDAGV